MRAFNPHVSTDADTWKGMVGKHEVAGQEENEKYLLHLGCSIELRHHEYLFPAQRSLKVYMISGLEKLLVFALITITNTIIT